LLAHRLVAPDHEAVWHIARGPGAGGNCSREIADSSFIAQLEKPFALNPEVKMKYDLKYYARVRDDLFLIFWGDVLEEETFGMIGISSHVESSLGLSSTSLKHPCFGNSR